MIKFIAEKNKSNDCMVGHTPVDGNLAASRWEPSCATLHRGSRVALQGIQLMEYGLIYTTNIRFSLKIVDSIFPSICGSYPEM